MDYNVDKIEESISALFVNLILLPRTLKHILWKSDWPVGHVQKLVEEKEEGEFSKPITTFLFTSIIPFYLTIRLGKIDAISVKAFEALSGIEQLILCLTTLLIPLVFSYRPKTEAPAKINFFSQCYVLSIYSLLAVVVNYLFQDDITVLLLHVLILSLVEVRWIYGVKSKLDFPTFILTIIVAFAALTIFSSMFYFLVMTFTGSV